MNKKQQHAALMKLSRLKREIASLQHDIKEGKLELRHNPFKSDLPKVQGDIAVLQNWLKQARQELAILN